LWHIRLVANTRPEGNAQRGRKTLNKKMVARLKIQIAHAAKQDALRPAKAA
jgi:hypothetical protein